MTLNSWLVGKLHQTRLTRVLRASSLAPAANWWWENYQNRAFWAALTDVQFQPPSALQETSDILPTSAAVIAENNQVTSAGDLFSSTMTSHCSTSKFQEFGYQDVYAALLSSRRQDKGVLLEIGIGHNDPNSPSGMRTSHIPGASLFGWANYLPNFEIHGADVRPEVLVDTESYRTHYVDQRNKTSLVSLASQFREGLDIIIDDGLHTPEANANVVAAFLPLLRTGGVLVIEDILPEFNHLWESLPSSTRSGATFHFYPGATLRGSRREGLAVFVQQS